MYKHFFKRLLDILISLVALPFVFLTIVIFGPIIFFTDKGPIFYCGKRIGKNGKPFRMIKFRSMRVNSPDIRLDDGSTYNGEDDPRVTKIGKFLRKTSIDELPQFLNVFVGQMSIIGPRPDPLDWLDRYPEDIKVFLTVRPGITGYSQAYFRNSVDGYEKMKNDAFYAENLSFALDAKIFFKTILTVFKHENTYKDTEKEKNAKEEITQMKGTMIKEYGYEYDAEVNEYLLEKSKGKCTVELFDGAFALRSGRDAIKTVAREYEPGVALLPALACDSMVSPFEKYGHTVQYYRLQEGFGIDLPFLREILKKYEDKTVLFLYMNYFGAPSISDDDLREMKEKWPNIVFINDITHVLLSFDREKHFAADYYLASLRKWIAIPDGGLLWCNKNLKNLFFKCDTSFASERLKAQELRHRFLETGNEAIKKEYRHIFSTVSQLIDADDEPSRMTEYSFRLLEATDLQQIKKKRNENAAILRKMLSSSSKIKLIGHDTDSNLYVPFTIECRDKKQSELSKKGIFNTIIWPLNDQQKEVCAFSKCIEEHMLAAPCDQRYSEDDMQYIGKEIVRAIDE